jgi:hypothetical protein
MTDLRRPGLGHACMAVLRRDLTLAWRQRGDMALPVLYALIVTSLFPFALGPEDALLAANRRRRGTRDVSCWPCCWRSTPCSAAISKTDRWNS